MRERERESEHRNGSLLAAGRLKWENQTYELEHSLKIYPEPHKSNTQITVGLAGISTKGFPEEEKPELALVGEQGLTIRRGGHP